MTAYQIETITAQQLMLFTFWGNVILLVEESSGRSFSKYYIKSKENPIAPSGWSFVPYTFAEAKKINLKTGETICNVADELGNVYYEVTSII